VNGNSKILKSLLLFVLIITAVKSAFAQSKTVVIYPAETDEVLVNPGMGITTFQRFNGQALNKGGTWSEEGPTSKLRDEPAQPDFPQASIAYCRWFWSTLEPEQGKFRWEIIVAALDEARKHQQTLAIRLMPYDQKHPLPEWYRNSGARRANRATDKDGAIWQPDFSDPLYLKYWGELVKSAGERYDGHPSLESVDISSVGYWGEGWSDYMPPFPFQKALIDIYFEAFKRTPLLMNFDEPEALAYGTERGAGWRLDCLGDLRSAGPNPAGTWSHMMDFYPQQVVRAGIQQVWQRNPVSLETCWVPGFWKDKGWNLNYIFDQALRWHVSSLNIKSSPIPSEWKNAFEEFQKKMGYRFILRRLEYPQTVKADQMMPVHMWWLNAGVAPVYRQYILAFQLYSSDRSEIVQLPVDVRKWLPGDAVFDSSIYVPATLSPGDYRVRLALLDPVTRQPAIRLAIKGREPDGWYSLGSIKVQ
jgi:hypothetical protein